jgi:CubicO group peptidase (beta-lactamase class C family)
MAGSGHGTQRRRPYFDDMKTLSWCVRAALIFLAIPAAGAQSVAAKRVVAKTVDSLAADFIATHGAPAVSIGVFRGGDTLAVGGWGKADIENDVRATARSVYRIGSITKQFTSAAVMTFVEAGKVRLDDSIGAYLPTLPPSWRGVTVRQLLNHTSGIPSYTDVGQRWVKRWGEEMTPDTIVAITAHDPVWFAPGSSWRYDNSGYIVLGMLVEKMAGRPWATDINERFAKPLGLADTRNCSTHDIIMRRASGYELAPGGGFANATFLAMSQPYAAGALCSTVVDLGRWNRALATGKVVSAESYKLMTTPTGAAVPAKYGFGLGRDTLAAHTVISHNGGINGFISANAYFPDADVSITVLTNSGAGPADRLLAQVARATFGVPLKHQPPRVAISAADRARVAGVYAMQFGATKVDFTFFERNGELYSQLQGQGANVLIPLGNNVFGVGFDPDIRITFTVENGKSTKVSLLQGGRTSEGVRK